MFFHEEPPGTLIEIVKNLYFQETPVNSFYLQKQLRKAGFDVDSRTVRYHLLNLEKEGKVRRFGRKGVMLTEKGIEEAKIILLSERFGEMTLESEKVFGECDYDLNTNEGAVAVNMAVLKEDLLEEALDLLFEVGRKEAVISPLFAIERGPKRIKTTIIGEDEVAILVLSSMNYDLIFQRAGVPIESVATGVLSIEKDSIKGFSEVIIHAGTTISPSELLIRGGYTSVAYYAKTGTGYVMGAIKTFPSVLYDKVLELIRKIEKSPLKRPLSHGFVLPPRFRFSMSDRHRGYIITFGGANYLAPLVEKGLTKSIKVASASYRVELMMEPS
ncbi:MAG: DUF128 domain-containing protein [Synergistetes bacterium]|nr:DUF128 domain-containing protein [Synergistota bacterium]